MSTNGAALTRSYLALRAPAMLDDAIAAAQGEEIIALLKAFREQDIEAVDQYAGVLYESLRSAGRTEEALTIASLHVDLRVHLVEIYKQFPVEQQMQALEMGLESCRIAIDLATQLSDLPCVAFYRAAEGQGLYAGRHLDPARQANKPAPEDRPKNHVRALPERKPFEMRFPVVEGYAFALQRNLIKADINEVEPLILESLHTPSAVFVKPQVGYPLGHPTAGGGFAFEVQDREAYYKSVHLQTITFEIARQLVWKLTEGTGGATPKLRLRSRHQLFPQVYRVVDEYVRRKVHRRDCHPCELGLATYVERAVERLYDAIEPNDEQGESPLLPILNRYKPVGKKPSQPGGAGYGNLGAVSGVSPGAVADGGLLRSQRPPGVRDSL